MPIRGKHSRTNVNGLPDVEIVGPAPEWRRYDPAQFIVPGSDAQGHHERVYCQVPPGMLRQASMILSGHKFPFRTLGDIWRWAIWEGLKKLEEMEPTPNTYMSRIAAAQEVIRQQLYLEEYQATIDELDRTVNRLMSSGAVGQARKLVARVQGQFAVIEEEWYRERLLGEISRRFGHLMQAGGRTGNVIGDDKGDTE